MLLSINLLDFKEELYDIETILFIFLYLISNQIQNYKNNHKTLKAFENYQLDCITSGFKLRLLRFKET